MRVQGRSATKDTRNNNRSISPTVAPDGSALADPGSYLIESGKGPCVSGMCLNGVGRETVRPQVSRAASGEF